MRTIKFRAKTKQGEWVIGCYAGHTSPDEVCILPPQSINYDIGYINDSECYYCIADTIGQFTGFHDKNGDEIYEGDIIEDCKNDIFVIMYAHGNLVLTDREGNPWNLCAPIGYALKYMDCNIIGNIHDNHELLQGGKE